MPTGPDLRELQNSTRKLQELLGSYRSGALQAGPDTGEFIEASILMQEDQVVQVRSLFRNGPLSNRRGSTLVSPG